MAHAGAEAVGIGLIGCGRIAQLSHLRVLSRLGGARLAAIAERDPDRLREGRASAPTAVGYDDSSTLLASPDVDAVVICLPTELHAAVAIEAFAAGKHVYVEKPLARTLDEARQVLEAWRSSGRAGMIGFNYRFHPLVRRLRDELRLGRIGEPVAVRTVFSAARRQLPEWKRARSTGGGALLDLASHHLDLVAFVTGRPIESVVASVRSVSSEDDTAVLQLMLRGGLPVQTFVSLTAVDEDRVEIYGEGGRLVFDRYRDKRIAYTRPERPAGRVRRAGRELSRLPAAVAAVAAGPAEPSYGSALSSFVDSVRQGVPVAVDLVAGFRSLAVVSAAEESARSGRAVVPQGEP